MNFKIIIAPFYRVLVFTLALAVLSPSIIKLSHSFNHHTHEICENDTDSSSTHFHEFDLDCEFYKFKISTQYYSKIKPAEVSIVQENFKITTSQYEFVSHYQRLQITLRGPPSLS